MVHAYNILIGKSEERRQLGSVGLERGNIEMGFGDTLLKKGGNLGDVGLERGNIEMGFGDTLLCVH
jgi:hypothetical protein